MAADYLAGDARLAETVFGWSRQTLKRGLQELRTGVPYQERFSERGPRKTEAKLPQRAQDRRELAEPESQQDPKFQSAFLCTRLTAQALRAALLRKKGWKDEDLPCVNTRGRILNRLGFRLRPVLKAKPLQKVRATDALFANVPRENAAAEARPDTLRISLATKAKVDLGEFSRGGTARGPEPVKALDHNTPSQEKWVPFSILAVVAGLLTLVFGTSRQTSAFLADCLPPWWDESKDRRAHLRPLLIHRDNGPENSSFRTQFLKRLVEFADRNDLEVVLGYYPPYHSKYNPIERCWGILEKYGNGTLLDSMETVPGWAATMTGKGLRPVVNLLQKTYEKGVRLAKKAFKKIEERLQREGALPKYFVRITPQTS